MKQQINRGVIQLLKYEIDLIWSERVIRVQEGDVAELCSPYAQIPRCLWPSIVHEPIATDRNVMIVDFRELRPQILFRGVVDDDDFDAVSLV
ncbi:hypothetical protein RM96_10705 [Cupriavidus sp. IDO]|nr:hypothetical protein RM96_10705 [Cupriavidus sp. IDO]